jgi:hypothetical protein
VILDKTSWIDVVSKDVIGVNQCWQIKPVVHFTIAVAFDIQGPHKEIGSSGEA